jgi:hypothetical protein
VVRSRAELLVALRISALSTSETISKLGIWWPFVN